MIENISFQDEAIIELKEKTSNALEIGEDKILFTAPVGSGKTVISGLYMDRFIEDELMNGREEYAFIWISPGKGDLLNQSQKSMSSFVNYANIKELSDILSEKRILPNSINFMNWESIRSDDNIARRVGEKPSLDSVLLESDVKLIVLVDEAHESIGADKTDEVLGLINPVLTIHITATPRNEIGFSNANTVKVDLRDVISEGIVKKGVLINKDLEDNSKDAILEQTIRKRLEIENSFQKINRKQNLKPLVLIQISNDSNRELNDGKDELNNAELIRRMLVEKGISNDKIGIWLSEKENCQNIENIKTSNIEFLIFKQAIATGWDCPRAHILVRFRETKSTIFDVQTIGRILRTVERKHYNNDLLDIAYIYTEYNDLEYKLEVDPDLEKAIVSESNRGVLKDEFTSKQNFIMPMYKIHKMSNYEVEAEKLIKEVIEKISGMVNSLKINENRLLKKIDRGRAKTINLLDENKFFEKEKSEDVAMNKEDIFYEYNNSIKKLYSKYDFRRIIMSELLKNKEVNNDPLEARKLYISNKEQINGTIKDIILKYEKGTRENVLQKMYYEVPNEVYYKNVKNATEQYVYTKMPSLNREFTNSVSEEKFEKWILNNKKIKWWFKNEVHGLNFSIAYNYIENGENFYALYYPDFFIITEDQKLFIVDVKAGDDREDYPYVREKYNAGKLYEKEVNKEGVKNIKELIFSIIKFKGENPYISISNEYDENTNNPESWISFDLLI